MAQSRYLTMRDGVRLAIDVHLPAGAARPAPTIVHQTRYFRSMDIPRRLSGLRRFLDGHFKTRQRFLEAGYAWVDVCVRGSGASFGSRPFPWAPDEVADGAEVLDWITRQPWSDGTAGATGISYGGTASEFLLTTGHPALKAVAPRFSLFDVYGEVAFPGGVHLSWFTENWGRFNRALDDNRLANALLLMLRTTARGWQQAREHGVKRSTLWGLVDTDPVELLMTPAVRRVLRGVSRVDDDPRGELLAAAVRDHQDNYDVHAGALLATFRDDLGLSDKAPGITIDAFSPHAHLQRHLAANRPVYSISGWLDGAYQRAACARYLALRETSGARLLLGPWDHGGAQDISPWSSPLRSDYDHDGELLAFFDAHVRGRPDRLGSDPVRYFTMGEGAERWRSARTWPPPEARPQRWYLGPARSLGPKKPSDLGSDPWIPDPAAGTGERSRWNSLIGTFAPIGYGDRRAAANHMIVWTSEPLPSGLEVTGHPIARLWITADQPDAQLFVYLEDVRPDGQVTYVTEGVLRALHRRVAGPGALSYALPVPQRSFTRADAWPLEPGEPAELAFELWPVSYRFAPGHRLRVAVAGYDRDHFRPLPGPPPRLRFLRDATHASHLELPVIER